MADRFRITLAQLNPVMGDLDGNAALAGTAWEEGRAAKSDLVAFPEMFITGYNPQDLVAKPAFQREAMARLDRLAADCANGPALAIGGPWVDGASLYNGYFLFRGGHRISVALKHHLPNETVFDEARVFEPGPLLGPCDLGGIRVGCMICEDSWHGDVAETLAETGAGFLLVPNGSPYCRGKMDVRLNHMVARVVETGLPLVYLNMVGGQDDQVFDGGSFALNPGGKLALRMPLFDSGIAHLDLVRHSDGWHALEGMKAALPEPLEQDYRAVVEGLRDYMAKTGFSRALLGLSGGIDSALAAVIAVDALGAANVRCVMLPSEHTSREAREDAGALAAAFGCRCDEVPISASYAAICEALAPLFSGSGEGLAEENIQSRLRAVLLMALSNKFGEMLVTTGNKSEIAVGYATIYGDMAGGYNPLKDIYKTRVTELCRWRNANHRAWMLGPKSGPIPVRVLEKPPSAELRPNQKDSDTLPDYPELDGILDILVDHDGSISDCVAAGFSRETACYVEGLLYASEYKRFQSAPGARLSDRAFWLDRRYPIVNRWRDSG